MNYMLSFTVNIDSRYKVKQPKFECTVYEGEKKKKIRISAQVFLQDVLVANILNVEVNKHQRRNGNLMQNLATRPNKEANY